MILLNPGNRILGEVVGSVINVEKDAKREAMDVRLCDFDDVSYRIQVEKEATELKVSMNIPCFSQIKDKGAVKSFKETFGSMAQDSAEQGFDVTLKVPFADLGDEKSNEELCNKLMLLKSTVVGGTFDHFFTALNDGSKAEPFKFDLRNDTTVFFCPRDDRVTVIFEVNFSDKVDNCIAKVFMQEFVDSKKKLGQAPPMAWGTAPPKELADFGITENNGALGYISFAILKRHVEGDKKANAIRVLTTFRNYIQYHIKCSKSYFHSRMRLRCAELLKVLNRAKVDDPATKEKKNAFGKAFARK